MSKAAVPLTPADLAAIEAAVTQAESGTTGEIYCVAAPESGDYAEVPVAWAAAVALLAPAILLLGGVHVEAPDVFAGWTAVQVGQVAEGAARAALLGALLLQAVLFAATALIVALPPVRRALTPRALKRDRVRRRAQEQFLAKNMHLTRERTGVLIFVSFAEHMAELVADEGIAGQVDPKVWDEAMGALTAGLKRGEPAAGFAAAVAMCGQVLAERFPPRADGNPNELPDGVAVLPE